MTVDTLAVLLYGFAFGRLGTLFCSSRPDGLMSAASLCEMSGSYYTPMGIITGEIPPSYLQVTSLDGLSWPVAVDETADGIGDILLCYVAHVHRFRSTV